MSWDGFNRRKFPRIIYPCLVKLICKDGADEVLLAHTENIGVGGVCVIVKREIKLFTPVVLEIDLLDLDEHIYAKGRVVWSVRRKAIEEVKPLFYDIGVEFVTIDERDLDRLSQAIDRMIKKGTKVLKPVN